MLNLFHLVKATGTKAPQSSRPRLLRVPTGALVAPTTICALLVSATAGQGNPKAAYLGTWEYDGPQVHFTLVLRPDGTGHLADEVDTFPFRYSLDLGSDPARLDLIYEVDMAFGRVSHTLVRLDTSGTPNRLHWVTRHSDSGPPQWPEPDSRTAAGTTWITFHRAGS